MRIIGDISEHEMVAVFLQTEIRSPRYATKILQLLERDGMSRVVVDLPDVGNTSENMYRLQLFTGFWGYGRRQEMFQDFPENVRWQRALLTADELLQAKYSNDDYWVELSGGSRRPTDAARRIRAGRTAGVPNDLFIAVADMLRDGAIFPELILVRAGEQTDLVVLEGHGRLTVFALEPDYIL